MEHQDNFLKVVDPNGVDFESSIPENLAPLVVSELPDKEIIELLSDGEITYYKGRVRIFREKDGLVRCFIVDKLEII